MATLYLVRHAHAVWMPDENRPLSNRGTRDAQRVADVLQTYPITAVYASPARRAQQTVDPLAQRLGLCVCVAPELAERVLCSDPVADFYRTVRATWDDFSFAHPGGECNAAAQRRAVGWIELLINGGSHDHIVLGTHGNLLALVLHHYDPAVGYSFWRSMSMPDVYRLEVGTTGRAVIDRLYG